MSAEDAEDVTTGTTGVAASVGGGLPDAASPAAMDGRQSGAASTADGVAVDASVDGGTPSAESARVAGAHDAAPAQDDAPLFSPLALTGALPFLPLAQGSIDYEVDRRADPSTIRKALSHPHAQVMLVKDGMIAVPRGQGVLVKRESAHVRAALLPATYVRGDLARIDDAFLAFLGVEHDAGVAARSFGSLPLAQDDVKRAGAARDDVMKGGAAQDDAGKGGAAQGDVKKTGAARDGGAVQGNGGGDAGNVDDQTGKANAVVSVAQSTETDGGFSPDETPYLALILPDAKYRSRRAAQGDASDAGTDQTVESEGDATSLGAAAPIIGNGPTNPSNAAPSSAGAANQTNHSAGQSGQSSAHHYAGESTASPSTDAANRANQTNHSAGQSSAHRHADENTAHAAASADAARTAGTGQANVNRNHGNAQPGANAGAGYAGIDHHSDRTMLDRIAERFDWADLRDFAPKATPRDAGLATSAVTLSNWQHRQLFCPRCGAPTVPSGSGWTQRCTAFDTGGADQGGHLLFPRVEPAVITLVVDARDRLLIQHNAAWRNPLLYSVSAGFVEAGENLEHAVRRETKEETGIELGEVRYLGSQPWPFPGSLMMAFKAQARTTDIHVDGEETADARWVTRAELTHLIAVGEVEMPGKAAIARYMIEQWYGMEL